MPFWTKRDPPVMRNHRVLCSRLDWRDIWHANSHFLKTNIETIGNCEAGRLTQINRTDSPLVCYAAVLTTHLATKNSDSDWHFSSNSFSRIEKNILIIDLLLLTENNRWLAWNFDFPVGFLCSCLDDRPSNQQSRLTSQNWEKSIIDLFFCCIETCILPQHPPFVLWRIVRNLKRGNTRK